MTNEIFITLAIIPAEFERTPSFMAEGNHLKKSQFHEQKKKKRRRQKKQHINVPTKINFHMESIVPKREHDLKEVR